MRDVSPTDHAAKNCTKARIGKHLLCENDKGVVHILLRYGSGDAIQVSRGMQSKLSVGLDGGSGGIFRNLKH